MERKIQEKDRGARKREEDISSYWMNLRTGEVTVN
jgi:hypothetical protein